MQYGCKLSLILLFFHDCLYLTEDHSLKSTFAATRRTFLKRTGIVAGTTALAGAGAMAFLSHATSSVFAASASNTTNAHPSAGAGINVLLVHGAFVDASSWNKVIPLLQAQGFNVLTVQLPMTSIADDVAVTNEALAYLATTSTPTILVGHSYGGVVISNAGLTGSNVRGLVYIAAFAPDSGETVQGLIGQFPATPVGNALAPSFVPNALWITPSAFPSVFMQDVDATKAQTDALTQKPWALPCLGTPSGTPTWKSVPSWYLVSQKDRVINPDAERFFAKRMGATTHEIASSHASPVSHPLEVFELIRAASQAIHS
jgi:pimeloyl-ACP methyl ester carboxylesterase